MGRSSQAWTAGARVALLVTAQVLRGRCHGTQARETKCAQCAAEGGSEEPPKACFLGGGPLALKDFAGHAAAFDEFGLHEVASACGGGFRLQSFHCSLEDNSTVAVAVAMQIDGQKVAIIDGRVTVDGEEAGGGAAAAPGEKRAPELLVRARGDAVQVTSRAGGVRVSVERAGPRGAGRGGWLRSVELQLAARCAAGASGHCAANSGAARTPGPGPRQLFSYAEMLRLCSLCRSGSGCDPYGPSVLSARTLASGDVVGPEHQLQRYGAAPALLRLSMAAGAPTEPRRGLGRALSSGDASANASARFAAGPRLLELAAPGASLDLGGDAEPEDTVLIAVSQMVRGWDVGGVGAWCFPVALQVALLAFSNGLVIRPPARLATTARLQFVVGDVCRQPGCPGAYELALSNSLFFGRPAGATCIGTMLQANCTIPAATAVIYGSASSYAAALATSQSIPTIGYWSKDAGLEDKAVFPSFMRTNPTISAIGHAVVALLANLNYTIVDVLGCSLAPSSADEDVLVQLLRNAGITTTTFFAQQAAWALHPEAERALDSVAQGMLAFNAHCHIQSMSKECALFDVLHYLAMQGLVGGGHLWMGTTVAGLSTYLGLYVPALCRAFEGCSPYAFVKPLDNYIDVGGASSTTSAADEFWQLVAYVSLHKEEYLEPWLQNHMPDTVTGEWVRPYTDYMVDATFSVLLAVNSLLLNVGRNFSSAQLLEKLKTTDFEGLTGTVKFDSTGNRVQLTQFVQYRFAPGTWKLFPGIQAEAIPVARYMLNLTILAPILFYDSSPVQPPDRDLRCPSGQAYVRGSGVCQVCGAGRYTGRVGMTDCEPCVVGSYSAANGSTTCLPCDVGSMAGVAGSTQCSACAAGQYNDVVQQSTCRLCERGRYSAKAASECSFCSEGSYAMDKGQLQCIPCNASLTTKSWGSKTPDDCVCPSSSYRDRLARELCHACPSGMVCPIGADEAAFDLVLATSCAAGAPGCVIPEAMAGFMTRAQEPLRVYLCLDQACVGGPPGTCAPLRDASRVACAACLEGAHMSGGRCLPCTGSSGIVSLVLVALCAVVVLTAVTIIVNRDMILHSNSMQSIMVMGGITLTAIQTMGVFRGLALQWFEPLASIFEVVTLVSFNLELLSLSCTVRPSSTMYYLVRQLLPAFTAGFLLVAVILKKRCLRPSLIIYVEFVNSLGTIFTAVFISMAISCILPLICYRHPGKSGESMLADASVLCWASLEHLYEIVIGGIGFILMVLPFIALVTYGIVKHRSFVAESTMGDSLGLAAFRFLFFRFQPGAYYYGGLLMFRSLLLCLLPVVIRYDVAFQTIVMSTILLFSCVFQMQLRPWRMPLDNVVDGSVTSTMVLFLMCGVANVGVEATSIKTLGSVVFAGLCAVLLCGVCWRVFRRLRPAQNFQWFLCHHKRDAAAQARLLKIMLQAMEQSVFIDSDDLKDIDTLFDIVRSSVDHLVVYLTREVLTRPWCAGEIATACKKGIKITGIETQSFFPPTEQQLKDLQHYVDLAGTTLAHYSITFDAVSDGYKYLLDHCQRIVLPIESRGRRQFQHIASKLLDKRIAELRQEYKPGMLVVSSDPADEEATATAAILVSKISATVYTFMQEGICMLADLPACDEREERARVASARALIVVLTPGTPTQPEQLRAIAAGMARLAEARARYEVVPVSTPKFEFPSSDEYYTIMLPRLWQGVGLQDYGAVRAFFKRLAVALSTHDSDSVIASQAQQIADRVPQVSGARPSAGDRTRLSSTNLPSQLSPPQHAEGTVVFADIRAV